MHYRYDTHALLRPHVRENSSETVMFDDVEMSASPVEFNVSDNWYSRNAYFTIITIMNKVALGSAGPRADSPA